MVAILKMAADKTSKISVFSDYNENLYLGLFWSEELICNERGIVKTTLNAIYIITNQFLTSK
jgi:hypothetical protein